jgi:hypothetical protein
MLRLALSFPFHFLAMSQHSWHPSHAETLKTHREAAGMDRWQLASLTAISVSQLQQLEDGGVRSFYSPAIKAAAGRKVLKTLGVAFVPAGHGGDSGDAPQTGQRPIPQARPKSPVPRWVRILTLLVR